MARTPRLPAGGRVPGHQRRAISPAQGDRRAARPVHLRGRRRPVDLRLARRQPGQPAAAGGRLPGAEGREAGAELPLQQPRVARGQRADRTEPARTPEEAVERQRRRRPHPHLGMPRRRPRGREGRRPGALPAHHPGRALERFLRAVPRQPPVPRAGEGAAAAAHPVPPQRRHRVPGPGRGQGRAGLAAPGRQPRRRCGLPARASGRCALRRRSAC